MEFRWVALSLLAAGCHTSPPVSATHGWRVGARLEPRLTNAGGVERLAGWHDPKLGFDCQFQTFNDGHSWTCLPAVMPYSSYFSAPGCRSDQSVVAADACGAVPAAYWQPLDGAQPAACQPPTAVASVAFTAPGAAAVSMPVWQLNPDGSCTAGPPGLYAPSVVAPAADFVTGKLRFDVVEAGAPDVSIIVASDGGEQLQGLAASGEPCQPSQNDAFCLPSNMALLDDTRFADSSCQQPVAYDELCQPVPDYALLGWDADPASADEQAKPIVAPISGRVAQPYASDGLACSISTDVDSSLLYYSLGAPLASGNFPVIKTQLEGSGRLQLRTWTTYSGKPLQVKSFYDSLLQADCEPEYASDGVLRCLPLAAAVVTDEYFADASCTQPVVQTGVDGATAASFAFAWSSPASACAPPQTQLWRVGDPYLGPLYHSGPAGCVQLAADSTHAYAIGEPVDPATLVPVTTS